MDRNYQLENLISEYRSIMMAKGHLYRLELRLESEKRNLIKLEEILEKEYQDLERFKETSVRNLFYKVLKSREEQYEIEKQEYLHAVLQFKDCKSMIELLDFERKVLEEKISKEKIIKQQIDSLVSQRNLMIGRRYVGFKNTMIALSNQLDQKLAYKREIHEALIAGVKASDIFKKMIQLIKSAKAEGGWGMKNFHKVDGPNTYVDQAQLLSYRAKQILQELQDEMEDVYQHKNIKRLHRIEDFQYFNELYYDLLISDWIVKNKIVSTLNYLKGIADTLTRIVETLKIQLKTTEKEIAYIQDRKGKVINENLGY